MTKSLKQLESRKETNNIFEVLNSEQSVKELDIRQNPEGFALVQDISGNTVSVSNRDGSIKVEEVNAKDVDFRSQERINDVFGYNVVAE